MSRLLLLMLLLIGGAQAGVPAQNAPVTAQWQQQEMAGGPIFEVRLRKLHLVRPDLIPYPIAYEIIC